VQSKFIKGLLFAWIPLLFFIVPGFLTAFRSISSQRTTGLGAVAGGLSEGLATFGLVAIAACEVYGVILLAGTFSKEQFLRRSVAVISIGCGVLLVTMLGALVVWFMRSGGVH
jgi:hypothetical protein